MVTDARLLACDPENDDWQAWDFSAELNGAPDHAGVGTLELADQAGGWAAGGISLAHNVAALKLQRGSNAGQTG